MGNFFPASRTANEAPHLSDWISADIFCFSNLSMCLGFLLNKWFLETTRKIMTLSEFLCLSRNCNFDKQLSMEVFETLIWNARVCKDVPCSKKLGIDSKAYKICGLWEKHWLCGRVYDKPFDWLVFQLYWHQSDLEAQRNWPEARRWPWVVRKSGG